jgi:hypothetical protein
MGGAHALELASLGCMQIWLVDTDDPKWGRQMEVILWMAVTLAKGVLRSMMMLLIRERFVFNFYYFDLFIGRWMHARCGPLPSFPYLSVSRSTAASRCKCTVRQKSIAVFLLHGKAFAQGSLPSYRTSRVGSTPCPLGLSRNDD